MDSYYDYYDETDIFDLSAAIGGTIGTFYSFELDDMILNPFVKIALGVSADSLFGTNFNAGLHTGLQLIFDELGLSADIGVDITDTARFSLNLGLLLTKENLEDLFMVCSE